MAREIEDWSAHLPRPMPTVAPCAPVCRPIIRAAIVTLAARAPDLFTPTLRLPPRGHIRFSDYLEEQNREDRAAAERLTLCPPCQPCPPPAPPPTLPPDRTPSRADTEPMPRGDERPHQDPHRPAAPRIGDVTPVPAVPSGHWSDQVARAPRRLDPVRPGRVIDVLA